MLCVHFNGRFLDGMFVIYELHILFNYVCIYIKCVSIYYSLLYRYR